MENVRENDESYHLGNLVMDYFNNNGDDHVWQIDAGTGQSELKSSVKSRTIQLARCLRRAGLAPGDVLTVSGRNHLDVYIPFYAAYLNGLPVSGIDPFYKYDEIKVPVGITEPKIVFCETSNVGDFEKVVSDLGLDTKIVTFGEGEKSLANFIEMYDDNTPENEFRVVAFDTHKVFAWLCSTSGSTGLPKVAAIRHSDILKAFKLHSRMFKYEERVLALSLTSVNWGSSFLTSMFVIVANQIRLQTSSVDNVEHVIDIINQYKPAFTLTTPATFVEILRSEKHCDLTCFKKIATGGVSMNPVYSQKLKVKMRPDGVLWNLLGQTETIGPVLMPAPEGPPGNVGTEVPEAKVQLVDPKTNEAITEPNLIGELWVKGPTLTEYYKNPEATAATFSADGWFKTGDLMCRDENGYFVFLDRMSTCFALSSHKCDWIVPSEFELVIQSHPDVEHVCVVGIPHPEDGKLPVACVQRRSGSTLTEREVEDLVADKLCYYKRLYGGVVFVEKMPKTPSGKVARSKVTELVIEAKAQMSA